MKRQALNILSMWPITNLVRRVGVIWIAKAERAFGSIGFIYDLVVWPEHRRQGYAAQATRALEEEATRLGLQGLALHVFGHNAPAQDLYVKLGYQPTNISMFKPLRHSGDTADPRQ